MQKNAKHKPSQGQKPKSKQETGGFKRFIAKFVLIGILIFIIWFFRKQIIAYIHTIPYIGPIYDHISYQVGHKTFLGLFYATFLGGLFFVTIPVEMIYIYYLTLGYSVFIVTLIAFVGNFLGMIINYLFGFIFGKGLIKFLVKENFDKFKKLVDKFGAVILVIGNIIPFPIEPLSLVYGGVKYDFKKYCLLTAIGKLIKFILLAIIFFYFLTKFPNLKNYFGI